VEEEFKTNEPVFADAEDTGASDRAKAEHDLSGRRRSWARLSRPADFVLPDAQVPEIGSLAGPASVVSP